MPSYMTTTPKNRDPRHGWWVGENHRTGRGGGVFPGNCVKLLIKP